MEEVIFRGPSRLLVTRRGVYRRNSFVPFDALSDPEIIQRKRPRHYGLLLANFLIAVICGTILGFTLLIMIALSVWFTKQEEPYFYLKASVNGRSRKLAGSLDRQNLITAKVLIEQGQKNELPEPEEPVIMRSKSGLVLTAEALQSQGRCYGLKALELTHIRRGQEPVNIRPILLIIAPLLMLSGTLVTSLIMVLLAIAVGFIPVLLCLFPDPKVVNYTLVGKLDGEDVSLFTSRRAHQCDILAVAIRHAQSAES